MNIKGKTLYYILKDYKLWLLGQYELMLKIVDKQHIDDDEIDTIRIDSEMIKALADEVRKSYELGGDEVPDQEER